MDLGLIITIVSTAFTLIFGIFAVYTFYFRRYPGEISCFYDEHINLHNSILKNLDDLKILYQGNEIGENMYLIKGVILNSGNKDITPSDVEQNLRLLLPTNGIWLDSKIISKSDDIKVELREENASLDLQLGLFRKSEYLYFEALADSPLINKPDKDLKFEHRIADTGFVKVFPKVDLNEKLKTTLQMIGLTFLLVIMTSYLTLEYKKKIYWSYGQLSTKIANRDLPNLYFNSDSTTFIDVEGLKKGKLFTENDSIEIDSSIILSIYSPTLFNSIDNVNQDSLYKIVQNETSITDVLTKIQPKKFKEGTTDIEFILDSLHINFTRVLLILLILSIFLLAKFSFDYFLFRRRNFLLKKVKTAANIV